MIGYEIDGKLSFWIRTVPGCWNKYLLVSYFHRMDWIRLRKTDYPAHGDMHTMKMSLIALQFIVAFGILNVWILRSGKATAFRGGEAQNLREEFAVYGLPFWFFCLIGFLKVSLALALIVGFWYPPITQPAAMGLGLLMLGAFVMHLKVKDPIKKALPSLTVLAACVAIALL